MAEQELVIGVAQPYQALGLFGLIDEVIEESDFITAVGDSSALSQEDMESYVHLQAEKDNGLCLVAELAGEIVGVLNLNGYEDFGRSHIGDVFLVVKETYRGYGIGGLLIEMLLDWVESAPEIKRLELEVQVRNKQAVHLYQKFGFVIEGTKKNAVKSKNGELLDVYAMAKLIG